VTNVLYDARFDLGVRELTSARGFGFLSCRDSSAMASAGVDAEAKILVGLIASSRRLGLVSFRAT